MERAGVRQSLAADRVDERDGPRAGRWLRDEATALFILCVVYVL